MKYAIINKTSRRVTRIKPPRTVGGKLLPLLTPDHKEVVEISDVDAETIAASGPKSLWFLREDGTLEGVEAYKERLPKATPVSVSRRGLRKALLRDGITFADIKAELDKISNGRARVEALIDLEDSQTIRRDHPLVAFIGLKLRKTEEEMDAYFLLAERLAN